MSATNNTSRTEQQVNKPNPVARNATGTVTRSAQDGDHASTEGTWSIFLVGGRPGIDPRRAATIGVTERRAAACVDN